MGIVQARREVRRLKARRNALATIIADKVETRRALSEKLRHKRDRDPRDAERKDELHDEIMALGHQVDNLTARLDDLRPRRHKVSRKLRRAQRRLRKLLRLSGPERALKAGKRDNGKHEEPAGSNWGPWVGKVIRWLGYSGPVYWCGCAAGWWTLKKGGGSYTSKIRRGYAGYVAADARAGVNGLHAVASPVPGGIASLWGYEHIVMTTGKVSGGNFQTCEGNTSAADGSQSNGGMVVYGKWRAITDADVFAKQDY